MADNLPVRLYHYSSEKLGSENAVRTRRLLYSLLDYVSSTEHLIRMTSGSRGEGLDMEGSDLDIVILFNNINIYESPPDYIQSDSFHMSTKNTTSGFAQLHACSKINAILRKLCVPFDGKICLSGKSVKSVFESFANVFTPVNMHGPCVTPEANDEDYAISVRCRSWISQADQWATRNRSWPSSELISSIMDFGVMFVPIGCRGSPNEYLEWRISFSAAEKQLIYSFSHTQLLCYALLKLLLKDIVDVNENLKGLLCSYFLKTVVFWASESLPASSWIPDNIITLFMYVFSRLLYYVEHNYLPHYFLTDCNLFEKRFSLQQHTDLKAVLYRLYQTGIQCMAESETVSEFFNTVGKCRNNIITTDVQNLCEKINILIRRQQDDFMTILLTPKKAPEKILTLQSHYKLQSNSFLYKVMLYDVLQTLGLKHIGRTNSNKDKYKTGYKQYFSFLLCGRKTDAVSGWLYLASYFYHMKMYEIALHIVEHVQDKCTPEKILYQFDKLHYFSDVNHEAFYWKRFNADDIYRTYVLRAQRSSVLSSITLPELGEWWFFAVLPPVVYAYFLQFLCFHHLEYVYERQIAINNLYSTIKKYCFGSDWRKATSYFSLGIAYCMVDDLPSATLCFTMSSDLGYHIPLPAKLKLAARQL